jgi:hypothetical protein
MREMVRLEVAPDELDIVQLRRILGQPLDGEPVSADGQRPAKRMTTAYFATGAA